MSHNLHLDDCVNSIVSTDFIQSAREGTIPSILVAGYHVWMSLEIASRQKETIDRNIPFGNSNESELDDYFLSTASGYIAIDIRKGDDEFDYVTRAIDQLAQHLMADSHTRVLTLPQIFTGEHLPFNSGEPYCEFTSVSMDEIKLLVQAGIQVYHHNG